MRSGIADLGQRGVYKPPKLKKKFRDFVSRTSSCATTWDLKWCHQGTRVVHLLKIQHWSPFTVVARLKVPGGTTKGPWWHDSRSLVAPLKVQCCGTTPGPGYKISDHQNFQFRWFIDPSNPNQLYHTQFLSKIWHLHDRIFFGAL